MRQSSDETIIEFVKVGKSFGEKTILHDLDLSVRKGEILCIVGGSGTGKSVLLKLLLGLIPINSGQILFKNKVISNIPEKELNVIRRDMGMVFQGSALFDSMTVFENVAYPLQDNRNFSDEEIEQIVFEKLDLVGLKDAAGLSPADLSGGMKKRVGLARAIATDPHVVLYDEPTAGLDPINVNRIDDLIVQLNRDLGVTSIVVTHHMESVYRIADRVAFLWDKRFYFCDSVERFKDSQDPVVAGFIHGKAA